VYLHAEGDPDRVVKARKHGSYERTVKIDGGREYVAGGGDEKEDLGYCTYGSESAAECLQEEAVRHADGRKEHGRIPTPNQVMHPAPSSYSSRDLSLAHRAEFGLLIRVGGCNEYPSWHWRYTGFSWRCPHGAREVGCMGGILVFPRIRGA